MQTPETTCPPRARSHRVIHRFRVMSVDVGILGFVEGGTVLEWIDRTAYAAAAQWCGRQCVTASVGNLHLHRPIGVGDLVEVHASVDYTGSSSMHVLVTVYASDPTGMKVAQISQCPIIFVAVDDGGNPVEVPRWTPVTMLELQRQRQARVRIRMRKRIEGAMAAEDYTVGGTAPHATLRVRATPADVDSGGMVCAGRVMRWFDEASHDSGIDWTGAEVITSYVAGIRFCRPIVVGDVVEVTARIVHTGPRSIHTGVQVSSTEVPGTRPRLVARGLIVVVSPDDRGAARPVPTWEPASDEDRRLDRHARHLIALREFIEPFTNATALPMRGPGTRDRRPALATAPTRHT